MIEKNENNEAVKDEVQNSTAVNDKDGDNRIIGNKTNNRALVNNKEEIPLAHYLEMYRNADPARMAERTQVPFDQGESAFHLSFLGRKYRAGWPAFEIECTDGREEWAPLTQSRQARLLALRYLLEGTSMPGTGKFLTYREVPWGEVYIRQFTGRCISRLAFSWGNRLEEYRRRMVKLGAVPIKESDAGYAAEIFPGFEIRFLIWEGDDEFPPSAQILFSDNFAAAFHAEDLVVAAEVVIGTIKNML